MTNTARFDAEHYVQRLDLGDDPFAVGFESDYFYTGANRRQLVDQLLHFSRFGDQTVLLVGATGSGTSTLLDQAYELIEDAMDCCFINAEDTSSPEQLIESLCEQLNFQLPAPINQDEFFAALQSGLIIDGEPEPIMLAVDQGHYLSMEGFSLLKELVDLGDGNICLIIAGEYQIEQLAKLASFNEPQIKLLELDPLNETESGDYILGLLRSVGYAGDLPLSSDQLAVLHERSGGNLIEINQLVPSLLIAEPAANASRFRFGIPIAHVAAVSILAIALLLSWLYQGADEEEITEQVAPAKEEIRTPSLELVKEKTPVAPKPVKRNEVVATPAAEPEALNTGAIDRTAAVVESKPKPQPKPAAPKPAAKPAPEPAPEPQPEPAKVVIAKKPEPAPAPPVKKAEPKPVKVEPKPAPVAKTTKPEMPVREQRLLAYPETNYMLQLIGSVEEARAREFVKRYINRMPVTYFETRLKGKPWFVVVTGPYNDKPAALAGIKVLPQELQKQRPWARSIAGVQKDIRANRQ